MLRTYLCGLLVVLGATGVSFAQPQSPKVAFVTNGVARFWDIAAAGAQKAGKDWGVDVEIKMPTAGVASQNQILKKLVDDKVQGIAVSTIDPANQSALLRTIGRDVELVTHDVDAPKSGRIHHIGAQNYQGGRIAGKLVARALPKGGKVALFVGRLQQPNAVARAQGIVDELAGRDQRVPSPAASFDKTIHIKRYEVLPVYIDSFDLENSKRLAEQAIAAHPDLGCMVGLFAYNAPQCLGAVRKANKIGKIKIVSFDEDQVILQAIAQGEVEGTVVQNPYQYGYESIRVLAALVRKDKERLPKQVHVDVPFRLIDKKNVDAFRGELEKHLKK